jgi:hypothetical protein
MNDQSILGLLFILKLVKVSLSYASLLIAKNIMSQIYAEKVYVKQESPPKLMNMLLLFLAIEVVFTVIVISLLGVLIAQVMGVGDDASEGLFKLAATFAQDYVCYLISMFVHGSILSNTMYSKKYFLYKDDGMRAIRAFSDVILQYSIVNGLIPFNFMISGILEQIKQL